MSRFTSGWIKLYRAILEKEEIADNLEIMGIWANLLLMANYKESQKDWGTSLRALPPGTILLGVKELSIRWKLSRDTILRRLRYLEKWGCIRVETAEQGTVVTICNWSEYQNNEEKPAEHLRDTCVASAEHLRGSPTLSEEVKKVKKEKKENTSGIRTEYPEEFDRVWIAYERKGDKKASYQEWLKLKLSPQETKDLDKAIRNYISRNEEKKFRKDFERFLKTDWREFLVSSFPSLVILQEGAPFDAPHPNGQGEWK